MKHFRFPRSRSGPRPFQTIALGMLPTLAIIGMARLYHHYGTRLDLPAPADRSDLSLHIRGRVVYEWRPNPASAPRVLVTELSDGATWELRNNGRCPRFSPEGQRVACIVETGDRVAVMRLHGRHEKIYPLKTGDLTALAWSPDGRELWLADGVSVRALRLEDGMERRLSSAPAEEIDVSADGRQLLVSCSDHLQHLVDLSSGEHRPVCRGCSSSFSPTEETFISNRGGHRSLWIRSLPDAAKELEVPAPPGTTFDNQWWSNHPDWIVSRTEPPTGGHIWAHRLSDGGAWRITSEGVADRPDLWVSRVSLR